MKVFKRTLSVCVALVLALSAIAAPITASATTPENLSGLTAVQASEVSAETLHPFTSTEALIRDAIEELRAMDITQVINEPDKALVNAVEKSAEMSYDAVKATIATDLKGELSDGCIDVSQFGLSKENMSKLMAEILDENYLYNAVEDLRYTTVNNKVTKVSFDVTEGYAAAMDALEQELNKLDVEISVDPTAEAAHDHEEGSISGHSQLLNADPNAACTMHTVAAILLGDANRDGAVDVLDCVKLRNLLAEKEDEINGGDVNEDGVIDVLDVVFLRNAIAKNEIPTSGTGVVSYEWVEYQDYTPKFAMDDEGYYLKYDSTNAVVTDERLFRMDPETGVLISESGDVLYTPVDADGNYVDADGNPAQPFNDALTNAGLLYNPQDGSITGGILADIYYKLNKISFMCSACGQDVVIMDDPETEEDEMANFSMTQDIWINLNTYETIACNVGETPTPAAGETLDEDYLLYTDMQIGFYVDDTYGPLIGPDGNVVTDENGDWIPAYVMDAQGNPILDANGNVQVIGMYTSNPMDNGAAEVAYYYSVLSAFNADKAEYFGVSTDYWTSKNTEANPMAALKVLCNLDPNQDIPPAQMIQLVQMLPQAFMAYVYYYGGELLAMRDAAMDAVDALPSNATDIHKMLVIHDWLAENAVFDMGSMLNVTGTGGNNDPIQMTTFGALLSNQLTTIQNADYYGGICLAYAAAYTYLVQAAFPDIYTQDGKWCTPAQVDAKGGDIVDFNQVMFYADTAETSIAGEGFGGGAFNNVHYFNAVKIKNAPTSDDTDDQMIGNWFYVDACYDDIYVECISQYRVEGEGAVNHSYFLVSPQTMGKMWASSIDYIDSLYDGYVYEVETDEQGNMVPSDNIDSSSDAYDATHPNYVKVETAAETMNDNTCYEDTWFSGAVSKIYHDGSNWYYVDSGSNSSTYSSMIDDEGSVDIDTDQMGEMGLDMTNMLHSIRVDVEQQDKLKIRAMTSPDWWEDEEDDSQEDSAYGSLDMETKTDPHATVLFDYGTGSVKGAAASETMAAAVLEDFIYNDQYPGLTHSIAMVNGTIYFNLGNQIWSLSKGRNNTWSTSLFREYNAVSASSDGRTFKGSSYTLDDKGTALSVKNPPIAAMAAHDAYTPLYNYIDAEGQIVLDYQGNPSDAYMQKLQSGQMTEAQMQAAIIGRQFVTMYADPTVTINLATNYSYTSAFTDSMSDDEKSASIYTKAALNYNPDYAQGISEDSVNSNEEFLWCANIRESIAQSDWSGLRNSTVGTDSVPCSAKIDGHSYQYDSTEKVYLCGTCGLHAINLANQPSNGKIELTSIVDSGISEDFLENFDQEGTDQLSTTTTPVSPLREGATSQSNVVVTVTPDEGYGLPTVSYTVQGGNGKTDVPMTLNEDGTYTGTIAKDSEFSLIVDATLSKVVDVTVNEAENGEVVVLTSVELPSQEEGEEGVGVVHINEGETGHAPNNDKLTISAVAAEGYEVKTVKVNDTVITAGTDGTYTHQLNNADITVDVEFAEKFDITVAEAENGKVEAEPKSAFEGDTVTLTVTPKNEEYTAIVKYTYTELVEGVATAKEATVTPVEGVYSFKMPASDVTVTATFTAKTYAVNIDEEVADYVSADPATAAAGATVTLTAKPAEGKELDAWTVMNGTTSVEVKDNQFTMPAAAVTVSATFKDKTYTVSAERELAGGAVAVKQETAAKDAPITVEVTPDTGYEVVKVTASYGETGIIEASKGTDGKYVFTMPAANVTVTATFEKIDYTINKGTVADGAVVTVSAEKAKYGDTVTITVTAPTGFEIESVTVDGDEVTQTTDGEYSFVMPAKNVTVNVTFTEIEDDSTEGDGNGTTEGDGNGTTDDNNNP